MKHLPKGFAVAALVIAIWKLLSNEAARSRVLADYKAKVVEAAEETRRAFEKAGRIQTEAESLTRNLFDQVAAMKGGKVDEDEFTGGINKIKARKVYIEKYLEKWIHEVEILKRSDSPTVSRVGGRARCAPHGRAF